MYLMLQTHAWAKPFTMGPSSLPFLYYLLEFWYIYFATQEGSYFSSSFSFTANMFV